jgi:hypothetical protein
MSDPGAATKADKAAAPTAKREFASTRAADGDGLAAIPFQEAAGNLAMQGLLRGAIGRNATSSGQPLDQDMRGVMEGRFGTDFKDVRVHTDGQGNASADAFKANAYTSGRNIYFAAGRYAPTTSDGRHLLAHELAHAVQQTKGGVASVSMQACEVLVGRADGPLEIEADRAASAATALANGGRLIASELSPASLSASGMIQRQAAADPPPAEAKAPPANDPNAKPRTSIDIPLIPPEWAKEPGVTDILTVVSQGRMIALPASGNFIVLRPPGATVQPTQPLVSVPTIGKEGMIAVNVGGRVGFQLDAGGEPIVVYPAAIAAIRQALGVVTMGQAAVTHIHDDHVRAFVATVRSNNIRPENLFYPAAFAVNAGAPGSTFPAAIQALQNDPTLASLGHGPGGPYQTIPTPAGGGFFRNTVQSGQVTFEFYGLTRAFQDLQDQRMAGQKQPKADTASLLTRVSFQDSGVRMLYLGDLRGSDLTLFEQAMGPQAYQEMLRGVRVITGFQHHMGALESQADRDGLVRLLRTTYMQTGELDVMVQSADQQGRFTINRSLMSALTGIGVNVHVAKGPQAGRVGTITYDSTGRVTVAGGGETETVIGSAEMKSQVRRLVLLNEAAETLGRYGRFVNPQYRYTEDARRARDDLKSAIDDYVEASLRNVKSGRSGRAQASLNNAPQQDQALQRIRTTSHPIEEKLMPAYMESLRELNRQGPYREIIEKEIEVARNTGRMSDQGIEALWEVEPEVAKRLVGESKLPRSVQRQTMGQLPGQPAPVGGRLMAGFMLIVTIAEIAAPVVKSARASAYAANVKKGLIDITWWQEKGVFPTMEGVNDRWWPRDNEWTTSPQRIQELLNSNDLNYLVLTGIPDSSWDAFTVWASTHLLSYRDWYSLIGDSTAVKGAGDSIQELTWSYRKGKVSGTTFGFDISEEWVEQPRLTTMLRAAARNMVETTNRQLQNIEKSAGENIGPAYQDPQKYHSDVVFGTKPQASGKKRFKQSIEEPILYTLFGEQKRTGYSKDAVFYVFANSAADEEVPEGYVVVGGADYNTYIFIYNTRNRITELGTDEYGITRRYAVTRYPNFREVLLAKADDLEDVPK